MLVTWAWLRWYMPVRLRQEYDKSEPILGILVT